MGLGCLEVEGDEEKLLVKEEMDHGDEDENKGKDDELARLDRQNVSEEDAEGPGLPDGILGNADDRDGRGEDVACPDYCFHRHLAAGRNLGEKGDPAQAEGEGGEEGTCPEKQGKGNTGRGDV